MADEYVISVVLEGKAGSLTSATKQGARAQNELKESTQAANIEFLAQVARYQAMTAALNQTIGGMNKLAGGLEAIGFERTADATRKLTKYLELIAGPAEIYLAYLTFSIAMGKKDVTTKGAQTAATGTLATATAYLNAVMAMNPFILIAVAIVVLITVIMSLDGRIKKLTDITWPLVAVFQKLEDVVQGVFDGINKLQRIMNEFSLDGLNKRLNDSFLGEGSGQKALA